MKKTTAYIFLFLSLVLLTDSLIYYFYQMSFAGYYSDIILFWLWFLTSVLIIVLFWKKIIAKLFLTVIVLALIGSIIPMAIPFSEFVLSMTSFGLRKDKNLNEKYRVQVVNYDALSHPWLELIEKKGIFERRILKCTEINILNYYNDRIVVKYEAQLRPNLKIGDVKDIFFDSETDSTISLTLFYGGPNKILTFNKLTNRLVNIEQKE